MRAVLFAVCVVTASGARGAYPLITEDTDTQGRGGWQLEGTTEVASLRGSDGHLTSDNLVLNYGLTESADLQVVLPWYSGDIDGIGDPQINVKWRFFEHGPFTAGLKPGLLLPGGDAQKGTGTDKTNWALTLIGGYQVGDFAVHVDAQYQRNQNTVGDRDSIRHVSAGVLYQMGSVRLVADFTRETPADSGVDESARYNVVGLIWTIRPDFGVGVGWKKGYGGAALDDAWLFGAGVRW